MGVTGLDLSPHTTAGSFLRRDGRVGVNPLQVVSRVVKVFGFGPRMMSMVQTVFLFCVRVCDEFLRDGS